MILQWDLTNKLTPTAIFDSPHLKVQFLQCWVRSQSISQLVDAPLSFTNSEAIRALMLAYFNVKNIFGQHTSLGRATQILPIKADDATLFTSRTLHNVCFIDAAYCQTSSACMWKQLYKTDMKWSPIRYLHRHVRKSWWTTRVCGSAGTAASLICSVHIDTYCDLIMWEKSSTYPMKIIDSDHRQQSDDLLFFPEGTTKEKSTALDRQHSHGVQTHGSHVSESQSQVRLSRTRIVLPYKGR